MFKIRIYIILLSNLFFALSAFTSEAYPEQISELEGTVVAICHTAPLLKNIMGTGFVASSDGIILTADHVITDNQGKIYDQLFCLRPNYPKYEKFKLTLIKRFRQSNRGRDIAILKIDADPPQNDFPYLSISENVEVGDSVLIVGFPLVFNKVYIWPLFRKGSVASIRYKYEKSAIVILDLKSIDGYSGSPIISARNNKVIGVMRGGSKEVPHSDFSVATRLFESDLRVSD